MYYVKIGELLYLRCPGSGGKTAGSPGMLTPKNIKRFEAGTGIGAETQGQPPRSQNPILRGVPTTSARTSPPLVTMMGTSGV